MHVSLTTQQVLLGLAAHPINPHNPHNHTLTTSPHNPPIMAFSSSISDWECGACASIYKGGIYCPMCATPRPKCKKILGTLAVNEAAHVAFAWAAICLPAVIADLPAAVAKKDWAFMAGAPKPVVNAIAALPTAGGKRQGQLMAHPRQWQRHQRSVPW
jgi:hypothetical protein